MCDAEEIAISARAVSLTDLQKRFAKAGKIESLRVVKAVNDKAKNEGLSLYYFSWTDNRACIVATPESIANGNIVVSEALALELYSAAAFITPAEIFSKILFKKRFA